MGERLRRSSDAELWVAALPRACRIDLKSVLPSVETAQIEELKVIFFLQRTVADFSHEKQAFDEKDRHIEQFFNVAQQIHTRLSGQWFECFDPSSGLPMISPAGPSVWNDLDIIQRILKLPLIEIGGCQLLRHPDFGFNCYPGSMLTAAGWEELRQTCESVDLGEGGEGRNANVASNDRPGTSDRP